MTKEEFDAIIDDAVKNGADPKAAEAYVRAGYKIGEDEFKDEKKSPVDKEADPKQ